MTAQGNQAQSGKTLVVGLGKTGFSCARYLQRRGDVFAVADSRERPPYLEQLRAEMPDVPVFLGPFQADLFAAVQRLLVSPGLSLEEQQIRSAVKRGVEIVGDIELFCREAKAPIVAITGSNGKSTVTTLLGEMAKQAGVNAAVGGNLGTPALDLLADDIELYILELSSFQLDTTESMRDQVAVVLNVSADHMDRYPNLEAYAASKARNYRCARLAVVNRDDSLAESLASDVPEVVGFTLGNPHGSDFGICEYEEKPWLCRGTTPLLPVSELRIPGRHNQANALASLALGAAVGLDQEVMLGVLRTFPGLAHRTQFVAEKGGLRWYNDSKGTNVGATIAALNGFHEEKSPCRTVLIAGGDCKGADFSALAPVVARTTRAVVLLGRDAPMIERAIQGHTQLLHAKDLRDAVKQALTVGLPGDRVLLSPACASFDMFTDYTARGEAFIHAVEVLPT